MRASWRKTRSLGTARRYLALVSLALFGHAVLLHLLHAHPRAATDESPSCSASIVRTHDLPSDETNSHDGCPACQLQHGFAFLGAAPTVVCLEGTTAVVPETAALAATRRTGHGTPPGRAPPTL